MQRGSVAGAFAVIAAVVGVLIDRDGLDYVVDLIPTYWPYLQCAQLVSLLVLLLVLLPMTIFRRTFMWTMAPIIFGAALVFGLSLWLLSVLFVDVLLGHVWMICGVLSFGIGIVPLAFIATFFKGEWIIVGDLTYLAAFSYLPRVYVMWRAERLDRVHAAKIESERQGLSRQDPTLDWPRPD